MEKMLNFLDESALRQYFCEKGLLRDPDQAKVQLLSGGVSCEVLRVDSPEGSFVVKKALPKLRVKEDWFSDVSRITNEKDCLAFYNRQVPESSPRLLFYDAENYLFGMEAVPAAARMWKGQLLEGTVDFVVGRKVAATLAEVHNSAARDAEVRRRFADKKFFIELRIDPYLRTTATRHPELAAQISAECERLTASAQTLVHGDYSPKNILVQGEKVYILDYEVAHLGDASFDLGFLTNHFLLKAIKNKQWGLDYLNLMLDSIDTYFAAIDFTDKRELERSTVRTLAMLFLARVDGKSPAEYITDEADKALIRKISYAMLKEGLTTYREVVELFRRELSLA